MIEAREKDIDQLQIQIQVEKASMEHEIESLIKQLKQQKVALDQHKVQVQAYKKVYGDFNIPVKD